MKIAFAASLIFFSFLSISCSTLGPKNIDARGRNGIERSLQKVVGLSDENDQEELAPPPYDLLADAGDELRPQKSEPPVKFDRATAAVEDRIKAKREEEQEVALPLLPQTQKEVNEVITPDLGEEVSGETFVDAKKAQAALQRYQDLKKDDKPLIPHDAPDKRALIIKNPFKEKFPGVIAFTQNDSILQSSSRGTLDKLAQFLTQHPDQSVMLQAQMGEGETFDLADVRLRAVQGYLKNYNIPQERIVLDERRMAGDWPEFRMYILQF